MLLRICRNYCLPLILVLLIGGCCTPPISESLPVTTHPQETSMWCWAASGEMVMDYLGHGVDQCTQANNRFGRTDCCNTPTPGACVQGGWPEFAKYNFSSVHTTDAALSWTDLKRQISRSRYCKKRPFAFTWYWPGGGGHMMVAKGYYTLRLAAVTLNLVEMIDPLPVGVGDTRWITYDYYVASPGHHTHWDDYYNVTYTGGP